MTVRQIIALMHEWERVTISTETDAPTCLVEDIAEDHPELLDREVFNVHWSSCFNSIWLECDRGWER